jgi:hypothetical protein
MVMVVWIGLTIGNVRSVAVAIGVGNLAFVVVVDFNSHFEEMPGTFAIERKEATCRRDGQSLQGFIYSARMLIQTEQLAGLLAEAFSALHCFSPAPHSFSRLFSPFSDTVLGEIPSIAP